MSELRDASVRWWSNDTYYYNTSFQPKSMLQNTKVGSCEAETDSGVWKTQRLGPFTSFGSYDWWLIQYSNMFFLEEIPDRLKSIQGHFTSAVAPNGDPLGLPPIHVHHLHINACQFGGTCFGLPARLIEQHGDRQLMGENGMESFGSRYGSAGKLCESLSLQSEFNDFRPADSPPLTWYLHMSVLVAKKLTTHPLSLLKFHGPAHQPFHSHATVLVPTAKDSLLWFSALWPHAGRLVDAVPHAHSRAFQGSLLAAGSPEELRLRAYLPASSFGRVLELPRNSSAGMLSSISELIVAEHRLICSTTVHLQRVEGRAYDRSTLNTCTWNFTGSSPITAIWGFGPHEHIDYPESSFQMHANWFLTYVAEDQVSHYDVFFLPHLKFVVPHVWVLCRVDHSGTHLTVRAAKSPGLEQSPMLPSYLYTSSWFTLLGCGVTLVSFRYLVRRTILL